MLRKIAKLSVLFSLMVQAVFANVAFALPAEYQRLFDNGIFFYDPSTGTECVPGGGDLDRFLQTLANLESGGDPNAENASSSASGKYQYIDSTWQNRKSLYGPAGKYTRASQAPEPIQDAVAFIEYGQKFKSFGGDLFKMAVSHYFPAALSDEGKMDQVPSGGNSLTPREYGELFLEKLKNGEGKDINLRYSEAQDFEEWVRKAKIENIGTGATSGCESSWIWPIEKKDYGGVSACWNTKRILNGNPYTHAGLDIGAARGIDVLAANTGSVSEVNLDKSNGNGIYVVIKHASGFWSVYKHLQKASVKEGDSVGQGDVIGTVNSTGTSTGDHLHFNIQEVGGVVGSVEAGGSLNPLDYLPEDGRNLDTGKPEVGTCIPGPKGDTGTGTQIINT